MKRSILLGGIVLACVGLLAWGVVANFSRPKTPLPRVLQTVLIDNKPLRLELAATEEEREQGLSDRLSMADDQGMLFFFAEPHIYPFWMNRMHFALDMIYLREGRVVDIGYQQLPPTVANPIPQTYYPKKEADMVLELTAGGAERYGLRVGADVSSLREIR